jgi:hypothetical protein
MISVTPNLTRSVGSCAAKARDGITSIMIKKIIDFIIYPD